MEELKHISFLSREIERLHISDYVICKILFLNDIEIHLIRLMHL